MEELKEIINFGFINIDKPQGPTSFSISHFVQRKLGLKKTSHLGTLDPNVTGVLPITLGRACKLAGYFMTHDKTYVGVLHTHKEQDRKSLQELIDKNFIGKIEQIPPHKSAVARKPRMRKVFYWKLLEASKENKDFLFECKVEGGTYIRKLCSDLGEMIGGAHMEELRRTSAGHFNEEKLYNLTEFSLAVDSLKKGNEIPLKNMITPAEEMIKKQFPIVQVNESHVKSLFTGKPFLKSYLKDQKIPKFKENELFAVFSGERFIEIARFVGKGELFAKSDYVYN